MNHYNLTWQTRLLFWLLSKRPDVDAINLFTPSDHLERCLLHTTEQRR
jgi:hypothetical protein